MNDVQFYLEGPGQELRPVMQVPGQPGHAGTSLPKGRVPPRTWMDAQGNLATQIDHEGFRYTFDGSKIPWALMVG